MSLINENFTLTSRNSLGLVATARFFASVKNVEEILASLEFARKRNLPVMVLGGGSNTVLPASIDGLVLAVDLKGIAFEGNRMEIAAGEGWHDSVIRALDAGLFGLENLSLIPGFAGAAPIQNIGAYGQELDRVFLNLDAIDRRTGEVITMDRDDCRFGYRDSIFKHELKDQRIITHIRLSLEETFEPNLAYADLRREIDNSGSASPTAREVSDAVCRIRRRKLPDPGAIGNVGSFFKNPEVSEDRFRSLREKWPDLPSWPHGTGVKISAAWMIDRLGLKGAREGGAGVSEQHALVLINRGGASRDDILALAERVRKSVQEAFGVTLEVEPVVY